jgi:alginate O-acetyltransferase complex protein AlgI
LSLASVFFIFIFLPTTLILYYLFRSRAWRNGVMTLASFVFFIWLDPSHLPQLIVFILANYGMGLWVGYLIEKGNRVRSRIVMWLGVCLDLLGLIFYKYLGFLGSIYSTLFHRDSSSSSIALFLGISYLTFSAISYLVDVYRETEKSEKNLMTLATYFVMFPKLMQGPITRYAEVSKALTAPMRIDTMGMMEGARRFIIGLAKKIIIADSLAVAANKVFNNPFYEIGAGVAWFGLIAYALQIYFDFSGYTDMAIGLGRMFGFTLPENFNYPYISRSITEFWRRWHMSLINWFRTYLFIPLEFMRRHEKFLRQQTNLLIVFLLTGLWHGPSWNYILWGVYFGLILAIEASGWGKRLARLPVFVQRLYTTFLLLMGWVFFKISSISRWGAFFKALFGVNGWSNVATLRTKNILFYAPIMILAIILCTPALANLQNKAVARGEIFRLLFDIGYLLVFVFAVFYLVANGYNAFIYGRF